MKSEKNIFLIGFMGSGKSSVSQKLSEILENEKAEMDEVLVQREGMSIADIFAAKGEPYFRQSETDLLREYGNTEPQIISCGGGVAMREENVTEMHKSGITICLTATPQVIYDRVKDSRERPILNENMNVDYIAGLMENRRPFYEAAADIMIDTSGRTVEDICSDILNRLEVIR